MVSHAGLPFVPQPVRDELLGAWLLRVAAVYGLGLETFLKRVGANATVDGRMPHWFALRGAAVRFDALSAALRVSPADLAAMTPPGCRPNWPQEMGLCRHCLEDAAAAGQPVTWFRRWMHPLSTVCAAHGRWLTPVPTYTLGRVRHAAEFGDLVSRIDSVEGPPSEEPEGVDAALWLQELCFASTELRLPWGKTSVQKFIQIVNTVLHVVLSVSVPDARVSSGLRDATASSIKMFTVEGGTGRQQTHLMLPVRLRHRQWLLGVIGPLLRSPVASDERRLAWTASMTRRLAQAARHWPAGALERICPDAAELMRRQDALQREMGISPRYFQACAALFGEVA